MQPIKQISLHVINSKLFITLRSLILQRSTVNLSRLPDFANACIHVSVRTDFQLTAQKYIRFQSEVLSCFSADRSSRPAVMDVIS